MTPAPLTRDGFERLLGEAFTCRPADGEPFELVLTGCDAYPAPRDDSARAPFALLFQAPDGRLEPQQIFNLDHPQLGELELFLVPVGWQGAAMCYEAVLA